MRERFDSVCPQLLSRNLPLVPAEILGDAKKMVDALRERGMLKDINFADVTAELASRPLTEPEVKSYLFVLIFQLLIHTHR